MSDVDRIKRETDVETLRSMALLLAAENDRLVRRVLELTQQLAAAQGKDAEQLLLELAELQKQLAAVNERTNGLKSEKRGKAKRRDGLAPQRGHGPREQPLLPIVEQFWSLDEPDRVCAECGGALKEWAEQFEESDEVDVVERQFVIRRHRRRKYRCSCGACIETAPGPKRHLPGGRYSTAFALAVVAAKYLDHLPLERQVRQMARLGCETDSQTLFDQCWSIAQLLRPAYERLGEHLLTEHVIHVDETRWPLYSSEGQSAASSKWHIWAVASSRAVYYEIAGGRDGATAESFLGGFAGHVMCDGYIVYESLAKRFPSMKLLACWAHARRKFIECESAFPVQCAEILQLIGEVYAIEEQARDGPDDERRRLRTERSKPVLDKIKAWVLEARWIPGSALEAAVRYMTKRWSRLTAFTDDPLLPLDNNAAERSLRGPVIGRKNHYGSRSLRGTQVAAVLYSLLESAKLIGLNPEEYLRTATAAALDGRVISLPHELVVTPS